MAEPQLLRPSPERDQKSDDYSTGVIKAIWTLLDTLPLAERMRVQKQIADQLAPAPLKKGGEVLRLVSSIIPKQGTWLIEDVKKLVIDQGGETKPKEVYNAVSYLVKSGRIRRVAYGKYMTAEGCLFETADELNLEPAKGEGDADD